LNTELSIPGSKSLTNRALIAAALADGTSLLSNVLEAGDTTLMIEALRCLGIAITKDPRAACVEVTGCAGMLPASEARISCGNAGTVMRFCTALTALGEGRYELHGDARMCERPIGDLAGALRELGAGIEFHEREGYPPLTVHASGLCGGTVSLRDAVSSQFVSAILLASPHAGSDVMIELAGAIPSRPYLAMTEAVMKRFGVSMISQYDDGARFIIPAPQRYAAANYTIEPDASNASYFWAAGAIVGGRVTVEGLHAESVQGDVRFVDVLEQMGCRVEQTDQATTVYGPAGGAGLRGVDVDLNDMPDSVQTLAVVALFAEGPTNIRNVANLRLKETDRLAALEFELTKLGAGVERRPDGLTIYPPTRLTPAAIDTYNDHRMAMSFAVAGLRCAGIVIENPACCEKTFPDFFSRFERMAATGR
jgi:3-phosphoshikimate 1-carboxyvinyltransferase